MGFEWRGYQPAKPKPVADGLKAQSRRGAIGEQWWSQRWVQALERFANARRLERGRRYARLGQVMDLQVDDKGVRARVQGSRPQPYRVTIRLKPLRDAAWDRVLANLASRASFAASLLAGEVPRDIEAAFEAAGARLLPAEEGDLETDCSCPDWENPCKHVAAVHYLLAEALDRDPFLLLQLRGRSKEQVLAALRERRARQADAPAPQARARRGAPRRPKAPERPFWEPGPGFVAPEVRIAPGPGGVLLQALGAPPVWRSTGERRRLLEEVYQRASTWAVRAALAGGEAEAGPAPLPRPELKAVPAKSPPARPAAASLPLGPRRVHASGRIMVQGVFLSIGREHAGEDVEVYAEGPRVSVVLRDGTSREFKS